MKDEPVPSPALFRPIECRRLSLVEQASWVHSLMDEHPDLDPTRAGRFARMAKSVLRGQDAIIAPNREDFPLVIQAMQDLSNLCFIWDSLKPAPDQVELWNKFKLLFGGSDLPEVESGDPLARNTQFELFALSMCSRSGFRLALTPRGRSGAEAICEIGQHRVAIEAKRISSLKKACQRIREARDQIAQFDLPGLVFVEFAQAVHAGRRWQPRVLDESVLYDAQRRRFEKFWRDYRTRVEQVCEESGVLGLVFCDHIFAQLSADRVRGTSDWRYCTFTDFKMMPTRWLSHRELQATLFGLLQTLALPSSS